jgi:aldose 1-epimerase
MMFSRAAAFLLGATILPFMSAQTYTATVTQEDGVDIVRLADESRGMQVSIAPKIGAMAYEFLVNGKNALYFPEMSIGEFAKSPRLAGVPLLWPWANRLDRDGYFFEGKFFGLQEDQAPFRRDGSKLPIHGLLAFSDRWEVVNVSADDRDAEVSLKLDYSSYPDLAAQFPFAHSVWMHYALSDGALTVTFRIDNQSKATMPVSLGFHPYFQVHDAPRDAWTVELPAASIWELDERLTPSGKKSPSEDLFPNRKKMSLSGATLDHVFGDLERDSNGESKFVLRGASEQVAVEYGPSFDVAVVYAPGGGRNFVCFEPMAGVTNAMNLAHDGKYADLQSIPAGKSWTGYFRIRPTGF